MGIIKNWKKENDKLKEQNRKYRAALNMIAHPTSFSREGQSINEIAVNALRFGDPEEGELDRIKHAIKHHEITYIIDGKDMCDWGWMTIESHNESMHNAEMAALEDT